MMWGKSQQCVLIYGKIFFQIKKPVQKINSDDCNLIIYFRTNHPQEPFVCDYCDQMFFNDLDFYQHVKEHVVYNPMESLEEVLEDSIEDDSKSNNIYGTMGAAQRQRKRGMYRKRVKVEITAPDEGEGELPRIGKKEGGLCPHCGEVCIYNKSYQIATFFHPKNPQFILKLYCHTYSYSTTSMFNNISCINTRPRNLGNATSVIMPM